MIDICLLSFAMGPMANSLTEKMKHFLSQYPIPEVTSTDELTAEMTVDGITYYDGIGR